VLHVYVDADACPVKPEIFRVAGRYHLQVTLVANAWMRTPDDGWISLEVVGAEADAADDWIVERVETHDIVITSDVPLASRSVKAGAWVISNSGKRWNDDNVGQALATRDLMTDLRSAGEVTGGPPPLKQQDRSRFLQQLDEAIQTIRREHPTDPA
jgi:uncharacterized protein YaiI (UPF0178 family)